MTKGLRVYVNAAYAEKIKPALDNVDPPWDETMLTSMMWSLDFPEKPTEGELAAVLKNLQNWDIALHWLINLEWDSKHQIPAKPTLANALKPRGLFLQQLFLLCERCKTLEGLGRLPEGMLPDGNASQLFSLVFQEYRQASIAAVLLSSEQKRAISNEVIDRNPNKKDRLLQFRREACRTLRDLPYQNPEVDHPSNQAGFRLMEAANLLANRSDRFRDNYYLPFVRAFSAETTEMDSSSHGRLILENDKAFVKTSRGRAKKCLKIPKKIQRKYD